MSFVGKKNDPIISRTIQIHFHTRVTREYSESQTNTYIVSVQWKTIGKL